MKETDGNRKNGKAMLQPHSGEAGALGESSAGAAASADSTAVTVRRSRSRHVLSLALTLPACVSLGTFPLT